jgi:hypothetical protein
MITVIGVVRTVLVSYLSIGITGFSNGLETGALETFQDTINYSFGVTRRTLPQLLFSKNVNQIFGDQLR